jgi:hypothetical protein
VSSRRARRHGRPRSRAGTRRRLVKTRSFSERRPRLPVPKGQLARTLLVAEHQSVEHLPSDASFIIDLLITANEKLDDILVILRDDEEEAEDDTDA